jgi:hypothetical protein
LTVPTAALRADSDIPTTALMLGIEEAELRAMLRSEGAAAPAKSVLQIGGRRIELPEGVDAAEVQALIDKRRSGGTLTEEERALLQPIFEQAFAGDGSGENRPSTLQYQFGGDYWVIAIRNGQLMPVTVKTGITDLARSEVVAGLEPGDEVLLLPSASLFDQQARLQEFISSRFSSTPFQQQRQQGNWRPF